MQVMQGLLMIALAALIFGFTLAMTALFRDRPISLKFGFGPKGLEASFDALDPNGAATNQLDVSLSKDGNSAETRIQPIVQAGGFNGVGRTVRD